MPSSGGGPIDVELPIADAAFARPRRYANTHGTDAANRPLRSAELPRTPGTTLRAGTAAGRTANE